MLSGLGRFYSCRDTRLPLSSLLQSRDTRGLCQRCLQDSLKHVVRVTAPRLRCRQLRQRRHNRADAAAGGGHRVHKPRQAAAEARAVVERVVQQ